MDKRILTILGPTASGKTRLAVKLADELDGEIISADSRQVYRGMDIGTGKDLAEYKVGERPIANHLIGIVDAGEKYDLAYFQRDFMNAVQDIHSRGKQAVLCGGTGLYIQSVAEGFSNTLVPVNERLRQQLEVLSDEELKGKLNEKGKIFDTRKRAIRFLEIEDFRVSHPDINLNSSQAYDFKIFGLNPPVNDRRRLISQRLSLRFEKEGLLEEVKGLIDAGLSHEIMQYYGLEYKYISYFLKGEMTYREMFSRLETEIHRFAKRQMTFFRSMEKKGIEIDWIADGLSLEEKIEYIRGRFAPPSDDNDEE